MRIEPATYALRVRCSTTEPLGRDAQRYRLLLWPEAVDVGVAGVKIDHLPPRILVHHHSANRFAIGQERLIEPHEVTLIAGQVVRNLIHVLVTNWPVERGSKQTLGLVAVDGGVVRKLCNKLIYRGDLESDRAPMSAGVTVRNTVSDGDNRVPCGHHQHGECSENPNRKKPSRSGSRYSTDARIEGDNQHQDEWHV